jgi:glyoxylase-like metal-dependent hydrolase (beta-lactamase superfamily II)
MSTRLLTRSSYQRCLAGTVSLLILSAGSLVQAAEADVEIGGAARSRVPAWDAQGLGELLRHGVACLETSEDGSFIAVGTIAPPGGPNLLLLDAGGKIIGEQRAGLRWVNEVTISNDGHFVAALSTTPEGTAGDTPRFYVFRQGKELDRLSDRFSLHNFRPAGCLFHYGDHSNHLPHISRRAGSRWVVAGDDQLYWLSLDDPPRLQQAALGHGLTTAMAASGSGLAVVGRFGGARPSDRFQNVLVLKPDQPKPIVWSRAVSTDVAASAEPEKSVYGSPAPPYEDVKFQAPLAVAIDAAGKRVAVADYEGRQRVFHPRDGSEDVSFGTRFMPSHPTVHVYDAEGKVLWRVGPESFAEAFWCELTFSPDGRTLLIWPHNWTSRGLGGQPLLPADRQARTLYVLDIAGGGLRTVRLPDAVSCVDIGTQDRIAVGCWDHKVYVLDKTCRPIRGLPNGLNVGAASLVRVSQDGRRITVATSAGTVRMLDSDGRELWQTDLNKAVKTVAKPDARRLQPGKVGPGIWRTNGGLAHSDMGSQHLIEAPQGLILIDPNAGASFAQNWAKIEAAGFDPMQVKYVLLTHEHGDHAPGAYLWRVITGAQVVASAEMAYILQHHIPGGTGYGFHPPQPVDIALAEDKELDLAGLKVKAIRLPGHTSGSMGYVFAKEGQSYVATGDLIMPGGVLGYSGSLDFSAADVLASLKKLAAIRPDVVLGGHGGGGPDEFIAKGIEIGEATGWSRMKPLKPNPLCRFTQTNYLVVAWLEPIVAAAYGDVDGDGRPDVAVLVPQAKGAAVKIYLNHDRKFAPTPDAVVDLPDLSRPAKLRLVRLSGGRAADFFVAGESQAALLLAQQERLKFKPVPLEVTRGTHVAAGDFNGDGRADLLIGSRFVGAYSVARQQADGTFGARNAEAKVDSYMDLALADVDGDKREDLLLSNGDVFLRQPDGTLANRPAFHLAGPTGGEGKGWVFMAAADFDRDGRADVALLANGQEGASVWLYRNARNPQRPFPREPNTKFILPDTIVNRDGPTVADWNGDGLPDVILCQGGKQPGVAILTGAAADGLDPRRVISLNLDYTPHHDARFGVADFVGNGRLGLAGFGRAATGAVGVYIWLQPAP